MPNLLQVIFRAGTRAQYDALQQKDEGSLYFITDEKLLYRGDGSPYSRYLVGAVPRADNENEIQAIRLTDKHTGDVYDIPLLAAVDGMLEAHLVLHYHEKTIESQAQMLQAIGATEGTIASGEVKAGTVFRIDGKQSEGILTLNPGQFVQTGASFTAKTHDLVIALYDITHGQVFKEAGAAGETWTYNKQAFAVIPTDLVNLVTADGALDNNRLILGAGQKKIKAMPFAGANKILATNQENNGVEWITPETAQNVVYWEEIAGE